MDALNTPPDPRKPSADLVELERLGAAYDRAAGAFLLAMDELIGPDSPAPVDLDVKALFVSTMLHFKPKFISAAMAAAQVRRETDNG